MRRFIARISLVFAAVPLLVAASVSAGPLDYFTDFGGQPQDLFFVNFEGGVANPGVTCGVDACATFEKQGQRDYMRIAVNPSLTPGFYTNVDAAQVDLGIPDATNTGPYTATYGHPVTMEAKIKWSENYDLLGLSDAQGTSGIALWNSAFDGPHGSPTPEYDQIGFGWNSADVIGGLISGFNGASFVDQFPVGVSRPARPINIHEWIKVKLVWSEDAAGVQSVNYYADHQLLGTHVLPVNLEGLSLEIWNDNQEPIFCEVGICESYPNPNQTQSFYVDFVKITQP